MVGRTVGRTTGADSGNVPAMKTETVPDARAATTLAASNFSENKMRARDARPQ